MRIHVSRLAQVMLLCFPAIGAALPLNEYNARAGDTLDLFMSGSSAQDSGLQQLFRYICEANTLDVYRANGGDARLLFCRIKSGTGGLPGGLAGLKVAVNKSSIGGSGAGVGPLIKRATVSFFNVSEVRGQFAQRCPAEKRTRHAAEGGLIAYTEYECSNPTPDQEVPDAGISDVEPQYFFGVYHLAPEAVDELSVHSANAFIFGVPVTLKFRDALQSARFARHDDCNPASPRYADLVEVNHGIRAKRGETEACMPSLSRAQLAGIFSGVVTTWAQIVNSQGLALAARNPRTAQITSPPGVRPPSDDRAHVCRRVPTSGTQAAFEMFFLNQRCTAGVPPFVDSGDTVFQGSTTSDVENCLARLDERNVWAVGIMTTESVESLEDDHWRFIKMDGFAPTLLNAYSGRWPFFVQQSYQWRNEHSEQPLRGAKLALMAQIGLQLGNPAIIRDLNRGFRHVWGNAGVMALSNPGMSLPPHALPGKPVNQAVLDDNPMLAVRHHSNNCSALVTQYPTALP